MGKLVLGRASGTGEVINLPQIDRFGHMLIVGPTRCGKTSKIIIPCIWQDLIDIKIKRLKLAALQDRIYGETREEIEKYKERAKRKYKSLVEDQRIEAITHDITLYVEKITEKRDEKLKKINMQQYVSGLTVIEPKGDLAEKVVLMCRMLGLPYKYLNPLDENTDRLNIMYGDPDTVAESNRTVLRNLFGQQVAFFAQVQETTARNTMLLLKKLKGNDISLPDVGRALRESKELKKLVDEYDKKCTGGNGDDLSAFFRSEVFGTLKDKFYQFAMGLRQQIEDIGQNKFLKRVLVGETDVDLDRHLEEGGILIVNTCMGTLGRLGDIFGQFIVMHLQNAVFRRPGNEKNRPDHYLWIDEAPRYINPDFERLLAIGGSFRCSVNIAIQTIGQLRKKGMEAFAEITLANCRNRVIFGGLPSEDAKLFEAEFGADIKLASEYQYKYGTLTPIPALLPRGYRKKEQKKNRFEYTDIIELKSEQLKAEAIVRYYKKGAIQKPVKIITKVVRYKKPLKLVFLEYRSSRKTGSHSQLSVINVLNSLISTMTNVFKNPGHFTKFNISRATKESDNPNMIDIETIDKSLTHSNETEENIKEDTIQLLPYSFKCNLSVSKEGTQAEVNNISNIQEEMEVHGNDHSGKRTASNNTDSELRQKTKRRGRPPKRAENSCETTVVPDEKEKTCGQITDGSSKTKTKKRGSAQTYEWVD